METHLKTPEQIEFASLFERLKREQGINQSALARLLRISKAAVSMFLAGDSNPSERTLSDLRALVNGPSAAAHLAKMDKDDLLSQLHELRESDPERYQTAGDILRAFINSSSGPAAKKKESVQDIARKAAKSELRKIVKKPTASTRPRTHAPDESAE